MNARDLEPAAAESSSPARSTTIVAVRRDGKTAVGGDGQVTLGSTVIKSSASKIRTFQDGSVVVGFAGGAADAFALLERFEGMLEKYQGNVLRASIELAKLWRTDRALRPLQSTMIVADATALLLVSGNGDVIQPDDGVVAVGSGGPFALAAARALLAHTQLGAGEIARESLRIAARICIYTNEDVTVEELS